MMNIDYTGWKWYLDLTKEGFNDNLGNTWSVQNGCGVPYLTDTSKMDKGLFSAASMFDSNYYGQQYNLLDNGILATSDVLSGYQAFTFEIWFKVYIINTAQYYQYLFTVFNGSTRSFSIAFNNNWSHTDNMWMYVTINNQTLPNSGFYLSQGKLIWNRIVITRDNDYNWDMCVNGVWADSTKQIESDLILPNSTVYIGYSNVEGSQGVAGLIPFVRMTDSVVYDRSNLDIYNWRPDLFDNDGLYFY